ncbi:LysR family transcriptional regulator [Thalassotalea nanhaiensis]|uniref:LysR family transcriptional regulator n=1 Tax=Thalassotalea nanhaiensis TaxID=3065648 RepID=A0ABY9TN53_9GAMM|nr:LysR family transcriptional regulator [Colwelliaceae bacterium SQ345]
MESEQILSRIDLNLLIALSVLLKERNVSRAADKLFISQPAMSKTLQRLRDTFDDPMFYRTSDGMMPTEKAQYIGKQLPYIIARLEKLVSSPDFSAALCDKTFSVSIPPLLAHGCILNLYERLAIDAPNVSISEHPPMSNPFQLLESGELDFAVYSTNDVPALFNATYIGNVDLSIYAGPRHSLTLKDKVTLEDCLQYKFVNLIVESRSKMSFSHPVDNLLIKKGVERKIKFASHQLQVLVDILQTTDNLLIGPAKFTSQLNTVTNYVPVFNFGLPERERIKFYLLEHKRTQESAAHAWFKQLLIDSLSNFNR